MFFVILFCSDKTSRYENVLKKVELSIVPNDVCQKQLRNTRLGNTFRLHDSFICAGGIKGVDVCKVSKINDIYRVPSNKGNIF